MISSFADNQYLNEYLRLTYDVYVAQSPSLLCNLYLLNSNFRTSGNYSVYSQKDENISYDCICLYPAYHSTSTQTRTQSVNQMPQMSNDQFETAILGLVKISVGDKICFSADITNLLKRESASVFDIVQVDMVGQMFDVRTMYKVSLVRNTVVTEPDIQRLTTDNYVFLPFSNKFTHLAHYHYYVMSLELVRNIVDEIKSRYLHGYHKLSNSDTNTSVVTNLSLIVSYILNYLNVNKTNLYGIFRNINATYFPIVDTTFNTGQVCCIETKTSIRDTYTLRKYPFINKFETVYNANITTSSTEICPELQSFFSPEIINFLTRCKTITKYKLQSEIETIASEYVSYLQNLDLTQVNTISLAVLPCMLLKILDGLCDEYSR